MAETPFARSRRVLQLLGGQSAPVASSGTGRRVLYRCPTCQRVWLQDGARRQLEVSERELALLVRDLSARLDVLPVEPCRLCVFRARTGVMEIDEYGSRDGDGRGFGLNWEAPEPVGAHLLATIVARSWLLRQTRLAPDILTSPTRLRAVLRWLTEASAFPLGMVLTEVESAELARSNPPGFGMEGTTDWQWKGGIFQLLCPSLRDEAIVSLAIALPPCEPLAIPEVIAHGPPLAELLLLSGSVGGDQ